MEVGFSGFTWSYTGPTTTNPVNFQDVPAKHCVLKYLIYNWKKIFILGNCLPK